MFIAVFIESRLASIKMYSISYKWFLARITNLNTVDTSCTTYFLTYNKYHLSSKFAAPQVQRSVYNNITEKDPYHHMDDILIRRIYLHAAPLLQVTKNKIMVEIIFSVI